MYVHNEKHQTRPLNLPPRPQNNVESVRNENNIDRWGNGGGLFFVITMRMTILGKVSSMFCPGLQHR